MRRKFTILTAVVMLLTMIILPMRAWAEDSPDYTYTLSSGDFTTSIHSHTSGAYTWTYEHGAGTESYAWDGTYGFKFGSGNSSYPTSFTLTSSSVSSRIKKVVVTANVNSGKSCKLDVKVGSTTYGSQATINTKNDDTWEFSIADASTVNGAVELSFSSNTGPLYLKKIEIYYYVGNIPTISIEPATISADYTGSYNDGYSEGALTMTTTNISGTSTNVFSFVYCATENGSYSSTVPETMGGTDAFLPSVHYYTTNTFKIGWFIDENDTDDIHECYFKVKYGTDTYSNAVHVRQTAYEYTVSFDVDDGTFVPNDDFEDDIVGLPAGTYHLPSATKTDYVLAGWSDGTNIYAANAEYTVSTDVDFTAQWKLNSNLTITNQSTALSFDLYNNSEAQTITYTTSSNGNITLDPSSSDYFTIEHIGNTITITPIAVTPSTQTVTINQAADDEYVAGSVSFTVNITDSTPFTGVIVTFDATVDVSNSSSIVKSPVTFSCTNCVLNDGVAYRLYKGSSTTISTTEGMITQIVFTEASGDYYVSYLSTEIGNYDHGVWTGYANSVTFSASSQARTSKIVVTVSPESSVAFPTFTVNPGTYTVSKSVEINCATSGSTIYYTTDGTTPDNTSTVYSGAITVDETMALKAIAYVGDQTSYVATANYYIKYATASMPFAFDGNANDIASTSGLTQNNLGSYGSSPALKFEKQGGYLVLKLDVALASLSYDIQGKNFNGATFKLQTSTDGSSYTDFATYNNDLLSSGDVLSVTHLNLNSDVRYIRWILTSKSNGQGNVALGNIHASTAYDVYGTVTVATLAPTADKKCTIYNKGVLTVTALNNSNPANLIIEDGGQLITGTVVAATMKKNITAYTSANDGWNLISSPVNDNLTAAGIGLTTATTYDLYYLNEGNLKWINYKGSIDNGFSIQPQKGYLYANEANTTLSFSGSLQPNVENGCEVSLSKEGEGWNLVGNPFPFNAYVNKSYYVINGRTVEAYVGSDPVPTCTGIIVNATEANEKVTFRRTPFAVNATNNGNIQMMLAQQVANRGTATTVDNAIVSFNEGSQLEKFYFGTQNANLYIPQGTEEYAIAYSDAQGEMPVNFRANENGQYTLTVSPENVEMNYLHLIDNMTGANVDLLQTPSYSFEAKTSDFESRFRLVFASNGASTGSASEETFAFISNGNIIVNGEGTLQVIDVTGRLLFTREVNSSLNNPHSSLTPGVYVMRLINGDNVRTQKIVIE